MDQNVIKYKYQKIDINIKLKDKHLNKNQFPVIIFQEF